MALRLQKIPRAWEIGLLVGILVLAAVLRMAWPGLTEFKRDEALLLARAFDVVEREQFHLRGISSSTGFPNTALSVWLYALPLFVWKHVYSATLFTGLLNTAAVFGCWWLVRRYWGTTAAIAATLMFAVSPWAIFHSQKIWAQNLLVPLVVGWAIGAALAFVERRTWFILLHLLCLVVAIQVHFAAVALVPATIIFLIVFRRRIEWRLVILGGLLALLTAIPFFYYLFFRSALDFASLGDATTGLVRNFSHSPWRYVWLLTTGREIHALAGPSAFESYLASVPDLTIVQLFWLALVVGGAIWLGREAWRYRGQGDRPAEMGFLVLVWLLVPPLFFTLPILPVELHYLLPIYPAPYIAAGVAFAVLVYHLGKWRPLAWTALGLSAAAQVWIWLALLNFVGSQTTPGGYGAPVRYHLQAANQAQEMLAQVGGTEILLAGVSENPQQDEFAAVYDVLLRDVAHRFVDAGHSALFPSEATVAIISNQVNGPAADAYLSAANQVLDIPLRQGEGTLRILTLPAAAEPSPEVTLEPSLLFANWVNLFGYDEPALQDNGTIIWQIYWQPGANPDPVGYHFFNHLLDANGQRLGQQDAAVFSPQQWRAGDTILSFFIMPWPAGAEDPMSMRIGIYNYPALENIPLLDVAGNPYSDTAELPFGRTGQ